ncbi:MAG: 1-phosphofructokinase family hexose kinase [Halomonadaceae bacterium]|nr:MAG: 1-phosphofructokinase family hexose kinase [Halomonadaceae bacterium]
MGSPECRGFNYGTGVPAGSPTGHIPRLNCLHWRTRCIFIPYPWTGDQGGPIIKQELCRYAMPHRGEILIKTTITTLTMAPSLDQYVETDHLVEDAKTRCSVSAREPGGGGINVARNLHSLGETVLAIFPGGGGNGEAIERMLREESVPCRRIAIDQSTHQNLALTETASGRMFHLVFTGAALSEAQWRACQGAVLQACDSRGYLVLSGSLAPGVPDDFYGRLASEARQKGTRVVLDAAGPSLEPALASGVYLAKINPEELAQLGYTGDWQAESQLAFMEERVRAGAAQLLVVTRGDKGALMVTASGARLQASPPKVKVVNHLGAGDSFVSLMIHHLANGSSEAQALAYGVAAAAAAISSPGNRVPGRETVEALFAGVKVERTNLRH